VLGIRKVYKHKRIRKYMEEKNQEQEQTPVEKVTKNYENLKAANDKVEEELLRAEELKAKIALGGKSMAGQTQETPEETPKEYADKIMKNEVKTE
jgi:hypothetical protein